MTANPVIEERIQDALNLRDPDDLIASVKNIVADELKELSPNSRIEFTPYYNHTYIPDMVIRWDRSGRARERQVFVRQRLRATALKRDLVELSDRSPVVLGLMPSVDEANTVSADVVHDSLPQTSRTLVADARAVARMNMPWESSEALAPGALAEGQPLMALVRENVLDGGRGFLGIEQADAITTGDLFGSDETADPSESFSGAIAEIFSEDAAIRIQRTADLLRWGLQGGVAPAVFGELSEAEVRIVVPYLLKSDGVTDDPRFWESLSQLMSLTDLENLSVELQDVDISRLVRAGAPRWLAKRAQLSFDAEYGADGRAIWRLVNKVLVAQAGGWRTSISTDSRRLKGRTNGPAARWEDLRPALDRNILQGVELKGASRNIAVSAEQSRNVVEDVDRIHATIDDAFHVTDLVVKSPDAVDDASADLSFTEMTVTSRTHESVENLVVLAVDILGHRRPTSVGLLMDRDDEPWPFDVEYEDPGDIPVIRLKDADDTSDSGDAG